MERVSIEKGREDKLYKLNKAFYGLKQALRAWYSKVGLFFFAAWFLKE